VQTEKARMNNIEVYTTKTGFGMREKF
jgi:hypothetical protein